MKTQFAAALAAFALAGAFAGPALAQDATDPAAPGGPNNVDGAYVVADDDGTPNVTGEGESLELGNIDTGGAANEPIIYQDGAVIPDIGALRDLAEDAIAGTDDDLPAAPPVAPAPASAPEAPAPATGPVTPESSITMSSEDGDATELGDAPPAPIAAAPVDAPAPTPAACADYPSWYDAQLAYEAAGTTAADPSLVAALDPDADGIACEEAMETS